MSKRSLKRVMTIVGYMETNALTDEDVEDDELSASLAALADNDPPPDPPAPSDPFPKIAKYCCRYGRAYLMAKCKPIAPVMEERHSRRASQTPLSHGGLSRMANMHLWSSIIEFKILEGCKSGHREERRRSRVVEVRLEMESSLLKMCN